MKRHLPLRCGSALAAVLLGLRPALADDSPPEGPSFVLQVTPLRTPESYTIRVSADGGVERWTTSGGKISGTGTARLLPEVTAPIVELAESVPGSGDMGDGVREGDIWVLATRPDGRVRAFLEPLAPASLGRLVEDAGRLSDGLEMERARGHFLRAVPVTDARAERLRDAGRRPVAPEDLPDDVRALCERAGRRPYEFLSLPAGPLDTVRSLLGPRDAPGRDLYVELDETSWIQIELWGTE